MDAANRHCLGCKRTLDEIAHWSEMSDAEHARVLAELPRRKAAEPVEPSHRPGR